MKPQSCALHTLYTLFLSRAVASGTHGVSDTVHMFPPIGQPFSTMFQWPAAQQPVLGNISFSSSFFLYPSVPAFPSSPRDCLGVLPRDQPLHPNDSRYLLSILSLCGHDIGAYTHLEGTASDLPPPCAPYASFMPSGGLAYHCSLALAS